MSEVNGGREGHGRRTPGAVVAGGVGLMLAVVAAVVAFPGADDDGTEPAQPRTAPVARRTTWTVGPGLAMGAAREYGDRVRVTVSGLTAVSTEGGPAVRVRVTVVNGTEGELNTALMTVTAHGGVGGGQLEEVYDGAGGGSAGLPVTLAPGRKAAAEVVFALPEGEGRVDVEVNPGFLEYRAARWTGTAGHTQVGHARTHARAVATAAQAHAHATAAHAATARAPAPPARSPVTNHRFRPSPRSSTGIR